MPVTIPPKHRGGGSTLIRTRAVVIGATLLLVFAGCGGEEGDEKGGSRYDPRPGIVDTPPEEQR